MTEHSEKTTIQTFLGNVRPVKRHTSSNTTYVKSADDELRNKDKIPEIY